MFHVPEGANWNIGLDADHFNSVLNTSLYFFHKNSGTEL